jgi:hypothetical protein
MSWSVTTILRLGTMGALPCTTMATKTGARNPASDEGLAESSEFP